MISILANETNISDVVIMLEPYLQDNIIVLLRGDLASGKTTLVKKILASKGCKEHVTSPTFSLQSIYNETFFHYDLYNKTLGDFIALGLLEEFEKEGIHLIEWGDETLEHLLHEYGFDILVVSIKKLDNTREYNFEYIKS